MPTLSLVNPRRRRRHGGYRRRRNPNGTFSASAANPNPRRRHHRRRNPLHLHERRFFELSGRRRRRNPGGEGMLQGADIVDFGVAAAAFWGTDFIGTEYKTLSNQTTPSPWVLLAVKALATIGFGIVGEAILGRGSAAVMGAGLNTTMALADQIAAAAGQAPPFTQQQLAAAQTSLLAAGTTAPTSTTSQVQATNSGISYSASVGGL